MRGLLSLWTEIRSLLSTNPLLRRAIVWAGVAAVIAGVVTHFLPRTYLASATILPTSSGGGALGAGGALLDAAGLSGVLGSALGGGEVAALTYPNILQSSPLLDRTLLTPTPANSSGRGRLLLDALDIKGKSDRERIYRGRTRLADDLKIGADQRSGLITVRVATRDSVLSAFIVSTILGELNRFNVDSRASQGKALREFVAGRLDKARTDLESAENALARFRQTNLRIGNSPSLLLEQSRLEREVSIRTEVYRLLSSQLEMASIEEHRDTPTFTVIQPPTVPYKKYRPSTLINVLSAGAMASALAFLLGLVEERRSRTIERPSLAMRAGTSG